MLYNDMNMSKRDRLYFRYAPSFREHTGSPELRIHIIGHRIFGDTRKRGRRRALSPKPQSKPQNKPGTWSLNYYHDGICIKGADGDIHAPPHSLLITAPNSGQPIQPTKNEFLHSWMHVSGSLIDDAFKEMPHHQPLVMPDDELITKTWTDLYQDLLTYKEQSAEVLALTIRLFLAKVKRIHNGKEKNFLPQIIINAQLFMKGNIDKMLTIEQIANKIGWSARHLSREFKKHCGISPLTYHMNLKFNQAKKQLLEDKYSVSDIAYHLGYSDQFSFTKAFKKAHNVSPLSWKKTQLEQ